MLLVSILYRLARGLLSLTAVLMRRELGKDVELLVLRHENAVLHRQVARVRSKPVDRVWLAALSRLVPRRRWAKVFSVTPVTVLAWHRRLVARKGDYTARPRPGRPPTAAVIKNLVVRMATENPSGGHRRVQGDWSGSAVTSPPPRCGKFCTTSASIPRHAGPVRLGASSSPRRPGPSWSWTCCTERPSRSRGSRF
jgi:hypothetical protein